MYTTITAIILYPLMAVSLVAAAIKARQNKPEWMLILMMLSFAKTCIIYIFSGTVSFPILSILGMQIQIDDVIASIILIYCIICMARPVRGRDCLASLSLILFPAIISFVRSIFAGTVGTSIFIGDMRKYAFFAIALLGFYFLLRDKEAFSQFDVYKLYIDKFMNCVLAYTVLLWFLDVVFGINRLPGQINGTLSDGGSSFRVVHPMQTFIMALYVLYLIYEDLNERKMLSLRTVIFVLTIILMQWRTVVIAFLVGVILIFIITFKKHGLSKKFVLEICSMIGVVLLLSVATGGFTEIKAMVINLFHSFSSIKEGTGTFSTRTMIWEMMLGSLDGINKVFGRPFGESLNIAWKDSAHSGYIDYIMKLGYAGLVLLVLFMLFILYKALNKKKKNYIIAVFTVVICVYWIAYGFSIEQGAVIGAMLAILEREDYMQGYEEVDSIEEVNANA